jgi:hypothetical protein
LEKLRQKFLCKIRKRVELYETYCNWYKALQIFLWTTVTYITEGYWCTQFPCPRETYVDDTYMNTGYTKC